MSINQQLWPLPPFGFEGGIGTEGDVLVNATADGVSLDVLWREVADALAIWNRERSAIAQLLSRATVNAGEAIPQSASDDSFQIASEFGEPEGTRVPGTALLLGNTLDDFDKATRFSWTFLRDSTSEQVRATLNHILSMDNKLTNGLILNRLFSPAEELNREGLTAFGLWTGTDDLKPPPFLGKTFQASHSHYLVSGGAKIDSGDLETAITHVQEHGYGIDANSQLFCFVNPAEADEISMFKSSQENNNDAIARHDFIPSASSPAYLTAETIVGQVAPASVNGLKLDGSYGPLWIHRSAYIPAGYFAVVASGGANHDTNPISFRQHVNPAYQNLRTIPGPVPAYPIQESFFARACGVGTRHRGAGVVTQIKEAGNYVVPQIAI
jgi:hypothetical protein